MGCHTEFSSSSLHRYYNAALYSPWREEVAVFIPKYFFVYFYADTLLIDYQFTFSLSQEDDRYYTAINFVATPEEVSRFSALRFTLFIKMFCFAVAGRTCQVRFVCRDGPPRLAPFAGLVVLVCAHFRELAAALILHIGSSSWEMFVVPKVTRKKICLYPEHN